MYCVKEGAEHWQGRMSTAMCRDGRMCDGVCRGEWMCNGVCGEEAYATECLRREGCARSSKGGKDVQRVLYGKTVQRNAYGACKGGAAHLLSRLWEEQALLKKGKLVHYEIS